MRARFLFLSGANETSFWDGEKTDLIFFSDSVPIFLDFECNSYKSYDKTLGES